MFLQILMITANISRRSNEYNGFSKGYRNHPILFVGAGFSMRYLSISYSWPALLEKISIDLTNSNELYKDLVRENSNKDGIVDLPKVATQLEQILMQH